MDFNLIVQLAVYLVSIASLGGAILTRIKNLEEKVEKHNSVVERMYRVEESVKSAHHRIDEIKEKLKDV